MRKKVLRIQGKEEGLDTNGSVMMDTAEGQFLYPY